jgi:(heptosyl)LPS beta-1,4-glucosyltransferase
MIKISVVVNTWNEEKNMGRCLESVKEFAEEIVVCDMESTDKTVEIAKKLGAKVYSHKLTYYVEPARNFAVSKATGSWILVLDADEELSGSLTRKLKEVAKEDKVDYVEIPRKNIIFGKWIQHSRWWPDYNIRFFKKGKVRWSDKIHVPPEAYGLGKKLEANEENALIHYHYETISQYIERLNRYSTIQAENLSAGGYKFIWSDLIKKPVDEFLSRFFAGQGYKDGLHGLVLAILQAFSEFVLYLKVWEKEGFFQKEEILAEFNAEVKKAAEDLKFWQRQSAYREAPFFKKPFLKLKQKLFR